MHPYRVAGIILGSLAALFGGFMVIGILLPGGWTAERTVWVASEPSVVYDYLVRAEKWGEWTPSPDAGVELFGPNEGPGSGRRWDDPGYGEGEFILVEAIRDREVTYEVTVEGGAIRIRGRIILETDSDGTLVRWTEEGDFGWNPLLGYLAGRMNELQGAQMEASLGTLKGLVESQSS